MKELFIIFVKIQVRHVRDISLCANTKRGIVNFCLSKANGFIVSFLLLQFIIHFTFHFMIYLYNLFFMFLL